MWLQLAKSGKDIVQENYLHQNLFQVTVSSSIMLHSLGGVPKANGIAHEQIPAVAVPPQSEDHERREFRVRGRLQEHNDKLNLRLRILQPDGNPLSLLS